MEKVSCIIAWMLAATTDAVVAQTSVPTAPPTNSFFATPPTAVPTPIAAATPRAHACPHAVVKGGSIVNAVGIVTTTGCNWSGTIRFKAGDATLAFVSTSKISVRQIDLGIDPKGHFGGGIIAMKPNGDVEFLHARAILNEISVALDVSP